MTPLPPDQHSCGDIWSNLPSMGLVSDLELIAGITITPACDVSNFKSETITFLPIVSIQQYLSTLSMLPTVRRKLIERLTSAGIVSGINWPEPGYEPPHEGSIDLEIIRLSQILQDQKTKEKHRAHIERALAGLRITKNCCSTQDREANIADYDKLYGSEWSEIKEQIVKNSFRSDIHFLPKSDNSDISYGLAQHSVALMRYPITVPSEILTRAISTSEQSWPEFLSSYRSISTASVLFSKARPIKISSLKSQFMSDLLSRFTSLFSRIGSPDFSKFTITKYCAEIE
ncbi:hypothetical protein [Bosea sp. TND4EK4]|uniref:hypothetical protein n=1 Tax=Bosea sp. TND4EK4 TaxID=1907408 RepID=UPI001115A0D7|nr:hypothetical protein [Bosea sp. TND4EK4]